MNTRSTLALAPLLTLVLGSLPTALAQETAAFEVQMRELAGAPRAPQTFDVNLVRPELGDVCDFLSETAATPDQPINIVIPDEAKGIRLPSMKLRQVTMEQFASFLDQLGKSNLETKFQFRDNGGIWYAMPEPRRLVAAGIQTRVLHVGKNPEATLSLIDEAFEVTQRDYAPKLKYHQPSQSLIVTASEDDLRLVSDVVEQMEKVRMVNDEADHNLTQAAMEQMQVELDMRQAEIQQLKEQVSGLHARLAEREKAATTRRRAIVQPPSSN